MNTAQRILAAHPHQNLAHRQALEAALREVAVCVTGSNCFDRAWAFYDGSVVVKTRNGYAACETKAP